MKNFLRARGTSNRIFLNFSFFYTMFVFAVSYTATSPVLIELSESTGVTIEFAGSVFSFYFAGFVMGCYFSTWLATWIPRKKLLFTAYFLLFLAVTSIAFIPYFGLIGLAFLFIGMGGAMLETQISSMMIDLNRGYEGLFINLSQAAFGVGAFLGPFIAASIVNAGLNWRFTYIAAGILCLINILVFIFADIKKYDIPQKRISPNIFRSVRPGNKALFSLLLLSLLFYSFTEIGLSGWIPTFLRTVRGFSEYSAGQVISFFWLVTIAGRLFAGFLSRKIGILKVLVILTVLTAVSAAAGIFLTGTAGIYTSFILSGFFIAGIWPLLVSEGGVSFPDSRHSVLSVIILFGGLGGLMGPMLLGIIYNNFNLLAAMNINYIFMIFLLIALIFIMALKKKNKPGP
jgi:MFS family permease